MVLKTLPLKCIFQISSPSQTKRGERPNLFIHGLFFCLIDLSFVFIRPEAKEKSYKERFFHAMHKTGGPPMDSFNSMNEGRRGRPAFYMKIQTKRKRVKPYLTE